MNADKTEILPLGSSTFRTLVLNGAVYVDKTDIIADLARDNAKYFLARPRRFGKTLLVSAFESLFRDGLRDFTGLKIESCWTDTTYLTASLDFSLAREFTSFEEFQARFEETQAIRLAAAGFVRNPAFTFVSDIGRWMQSLAPRSLVLLIDEYDAPLTEASGLKDELFEAVRSYLSNFYLTVKSYEGCLRFFFMTGITKFEHAGIFSGFNPVTDISFDPRYGTILGYTEKEIRQYFPQHLKAARKAGRYRSIRELLSAMKEMYDGFCFDMFASTHVFAPWSVIKFLKAPHLGLLNYWYESGGKPTLLTHYLRRHELKMMSIAGSGEDVLFEELFEASDFKHMQPAVLLSQAGYYTIRASTGQVLTLGYPNQEMIQSAAKLLSDALMLKHRSAVVSARRIDEVFLDGRLDAAMGVINDFISGLSHAGHPIDDEFACRNAVQLILSGAGFIATAEKHNLFGRCDLEAMRQQLCLVFEFKYQRQGASAAKLLAEAVEQIKSRRYGEAARPFAKVIRLACVYSEAERRFVCWQQADEAGGASEEKVEIV